MVGVYRPAKPDGRAVLSIPGDGYGFVSVENEGVDVAKALTPHGHHGVRPDLSPPRERWASAPTCRSSDAQRAMRLIRAEAANMASIPRGSAFAAFPPAAISPSLAVGHADPVYAPVDAADRQSARPDFAGLVYPVVSFSHCGAEQPLGGMLLGNIRDPALLTRYETADRITAATPPIFLVRTRSTTVPSRSRKRSSIVFS